MFIDPGTTQIILVPVLFLRGNIARYRSCPLWACYRRERLSCDDAPPFGLDIFVAASTLNKTVSEIIAGVTPYIIVASWC